MSVATLLFTLESAIIAEGQEEITRFARKELVAEDGVGKMNFIEQVIDIELHLHLLETVRHNRVNQGICRQGIGVIARGEILADVIHSKAKLQAAEIPERHVVSNPDIQQVLRRKANSVAGIRVALIGRIEIFILGIGVGITGVHLHPIYRVRLHIDFDSFRIGRANAFVDTAAKRFNQILLQ